MAPPQPPQPPPPQPDQPEQAELPQPEQPEQPEQPPQPEHARDMDEEAQGIIDAGAAMAEDMPLERGPALEWD
jgi:hypothetical protein